MSKEDEKATVVPTTTELLARLPETSHEGSGLKAEPKASALSPYIPKLAIKSEGAVVKQEEVKKQKIA